MSDYARAGLTCIKLFVENVNDPNRYSYLERAKVTEMFVIANSIRNILLKKQDC
jgi:hypothetical protein